MFIKRFTILLIEDSPTDVVIVREALSEAGIPCKIYHVEDGTEGMDFLLKQGKYVSAPRPDLILLDLNLPRKNGHEVLTEIKANQELEAIPIIVLTTSASEQDIFRSYDQHANFYIVKPLGFNNFVDAIKSIPLFWLGGFNSSPEVSNGKDPDTSPFN